MSTTTHQDVRAVQDRADRQGDRAWPRPARAPAARRTTRSAELVRAYYRHVAPEDLADRTDADVYGAFASHYKLAARPAAGHRPGPGRYAHAGRARLGGRRAQVVEVVVDDMPFLVDSLTMELSRQLRDVHVVIHPNFDVVRDITGALQSVRAGARRRPRARGRGGPRVVDARRDRPAARGRRPGRDRRGHPAGAPRRPRGGRGLAQDARPGRGDRRRAARPTRRRSTPRRSARPPTCSSGWPTSTSPSSATRSTGSSSRRRRRVPPRASPAPGSASCAPTRRCRSRSAGCPRRSRPRPARRPCWCWPRPTPAPPCTARRTSTTSA